MDNTPKMFNNFEIQPEKSTYLPPPIIVIGVKDFIHLYSEFIEEGNVSSKPTINSLKI